MLQGPHMSMDAATAFNSLARERALCAPFARPLRGRAIWQLAHTLVLLAMLFAAMGWSLQAGWS
jgi:hypothetical protein